jgi:hypothetical protein
MSRKLSRMEANKEVRRVLNRNGVDLTYTQYSVGGMDVRLTGWLCRTDGNDFSANKVETMIQEFQRVLPGYSVTGDFDNWSFTTDHITYLGTKEGEESGEEAAAPAEDYESEAS